MALRQRPKAHGLYLPEFEHDSCGVGFVAHIKGKASHQIVADASEILVRMTHRGAVGSEENTGDGAGILTALPHSFLEKIAAEELKVSLPQRGRFTAGIVFFPQEKELRDKCRAEIERLVAQEGQRLLGWRPLPVSPDLANIGPTARAAQPVMEMLFVAAGEEVSTDLFERKLYVIRKQAAYRIRGEQDYDPEDFFYIASLSTRVIVYKGMLTPEQLYRYFDDLRNPAYQSHLAMVHSRFSTNTFPSWDRAQPFRFMSHNGEINTVRGNKNKMAAREGTLASELFGEEDLKKLLPVHEKDLSDSGAFDNVLELLLMGGRELPEAMMMMIPEAWQKHETMDQKKKDMYEYFSTTMEPWDGPASVAFTDGKYIGATLDRNGLRPSRFYVTDDDLVIMASEVGVLDIDPAKIVKKGRLQPGRMFLVNFEEGRIVDDEELKSSFAAAEPYGKWLDQQRITVDELEKHPEEHSIKSEDYYDALKVFGYTSEHIREIIGPMAELGKEPLGSMGNDAPLAVLSKRSRLLYDYFKQLFAQVTNPPVDSVREFVIMSLVTYIGPEGNLLDKTPEHAHRLRLDQPIITNSQLASLKNMDYRGWKSITLDATYPVGSGEKGLTDALDRLSTEAEKAIADGYSIAVLSDRAAGPDRIPLPALLATGGVHHHLIKQHKRTQIGLVLESAEPREVHHFCTLFGFGADAINPYLAYEVIFTLRDEGRLDQSQTNEDLEVAYFKAIEYGMLKVFGKMGISTLESYKAAQIFEIVGLAPEVVNRCFVGTASRIKGAGFAQIEEECALRHKEVYGSKYKNIGAEQLNPGDYSYRFGGEGHMWDPESIADVQIAARTGDQAAFDRFSKRQNDRAAEAFTIRGLLKFKEGDRKPISIDEVEPASAIMKRYASGAMSFGSISQEAHETLAIAMNRIGGKSNTGEGGELPERFKPLANGDSKRSAIKQVASGRFGVTNEYLTNADEIQIKMAQGAKPGEGGELPGHKVFEIIARTRHTTPGVGLISPPPHHDIYSIEDLAQLIYDLKNSNPKARISVKLVSEVGVGTIAAGVSKAHADHILISGHDGGTGASPLTGIKHAGLPWELGLAETHQTLVMNDLRSRVVVQTDGQLKTGRDVVIAALLGAEEFGFATSALITMGCIMMRKCHKNTCPVGIATQNEKLRAKFKSSPDDVVRFFEFVTEEVRQIMAQLGFRTIEEMVGRTDILEVNDAVLGWKAKGIDLTPVLQPARNELARTGTICCIPQDHGLEKVLDRTLIEECRQTIDTKKPIKLVHKVVNTDRSVGTMLSHEVAVVHGLVGLPKDSIHVKFTGHAGQSFGGWLASGIEFELEGDANDYVGKGLSGGTIAVYPDKTAGFKAEENIIIGNVALYGAIKGRAFFRGIAAERFCVRNSGAEVVIEGVGDHGCEYMTGGRAIILGAAGRNFAAGMSGGIAYLWDADGSFPANVNKAMVELGPLDQEDEIAYVKAMIVEHAQRTGSQRATDILADWEAELKRFVRVIPSAYKAVLEAQKNKEAVNG